MIENAQKIGLVVDDWDALRRNSKKFSDVLNFINKSTTGRGVIVFSKNKTMADTTALRDMAPLSFITDRRILSYARLMRLCMDSFVYTDGKFTQVEAVPRLNPPTKIGFVISNGYGLGHVTRMRAFMEGLSTCGPACVFSFSAAAWRDVFYIPSAQYVGLDTERAMLYEHEAFRAFLMQENPSHLLYDGNVLPAGMLAALGARPDIHLTWVRRGMWHANTHEQFMAQQALVDVVIEPGDVSGSYDTGPTWQSRHNFCPPKTFLKTAPIRMCHTPLDREAARKGLGLSPQGQYILLMLGASKNDIDLDLLSRALLSLKKLPGVTPVIAHWPISQNRPPEIPGTIVIEKISLANDYKAFDGIISAAGYNTFHELITVNIPVVFVPQEDAGRDQQLARATYAADHNLATLCRAADIDNVHLHLAETKAVIRTQHDFVDDWSEVTAALELTQPQAISAQAMQEALTLKDIAHEFKTLHKRFKRKNKSTNNNFLLALDAFPPKKTKDDDVVVVCNADPIFLRRCGYRYLFINTNYLRSKMALRRQIITWFKIYRPAQVRIKF